MKTMTAKNTSLLIISRRRLQADLTVNREMVAENEKLKGQIGKMESQVEDGKRKGRKDPNEQ